MEKERSRKATFCLCSEAPDALGFGTSVAAISFSPKTGPKIRMEYYTLSLGIYHKQSINKSLLMFYLKFHVKFHIHF